MSTIKYKARLTKNFFENQTWQQKEYLCGIDEVGRGCMAGPVVCAAAILKPGVKHPLLKDSKLLDAEELQKVYTWLQGRCWYSYSVIDHAVIDKHNIYQATLIGMKRAFLQLMAQHGVTPKMVLIDAMPLQLAQTAFDAIDVYYFNFGEQKSSSIAAASIIAKVTRDAIMKDFDPLFPQYKLAKHKGYCTDQHRNLAVTHGSSIIHRKSYVNVELWQHDSTTNLMPLQQTIETIAE